jgi:plastocyanin
MTPSEHGRRWRRWLLLCLAAVLGAAVVVMPALASSEGAAVEAQTVSSGYPYRWAPMSVEVASGGAVSFSNSTGVAHGIEWKSPPSEPQCSGVPLAGSAKSSGTSWSGSCTFTKAGVYTFYCTVHGSYMSGSIKVNAAGETTVTSTPTSTPGYPPPPTGSGSGSGSGSVPGYETPIPQPPAGGSALALLAGSASSAVKVPASQHGHDVRGSVAIAPAGAGARLEVDLFAHSAVLASAGHKALVRIGRLVVAHVRAGSVKFSVSLSRSARKALARRRRLAVTVHVALQSPSAKAVTLSRSVLLRP